MQSHEQRFRQIGLLGRIKVELCLLRIANSGTSQFREEPPPSLRLVYNDQFFNLTDAADSIKVFSFGDTLISWDLIAVNKTPLEFYEPIRRRF